MPSAASRALTLVRDSAREIGAIGVCIIIAVTGLVTGMVFVLAAHVWASA